MPEGVNIVGYVDNEFTDSGEYTATAIISYDKINYNPPDKLTHFFKILPAEYDMSGVLFENVKVTYDGEYHYPILISEMPIGYDGSRPTFTFSMGVMHVSDGASIVKITFKEGSKNYKTPDDMVAYVEILPLRITVEWLDEDFVYDEKVKCPVAVSDYTSISVLGGEINAGKYLAEAISDNEDYLVVNNKREYTILKAENLFLEDPQIIDSFEGKSPSFNARSLFGVPNLVFYTDKNLKEKINAPKAVGIYYCIIEVSESENYNKLVSTPMRCEVKALVPVKLHARLLKEDISAFYILSDCDFLVSVEYNDESVVYIDNSLVKVTYENGDSFKKKDSFVKFAALGMEKKLSVSVDYARYDMSQVRWENTELIYDKTKKIPTITGLPEGISLIQVIGGGINVGEYDVYAIFDYDTENYFEPELSRCKMKITPKVINLMVSDYDLYLFSTVEKVNFQILGEEALYEELSLYFEVIGENIVIKTDNPNYILAGNIGNINKISRLSPNLEQDLLLLSLLMVVIVLFIIVVFRRKKTLLVLWYRFKVGNKRKKESFSLFSSNETLFLPNPPKRELLSSGEGNKVGITQKVSELKTLDNLEEEIMLVDVKRADELITDTLAKNLLKRSREFIYTSGFKKEIVNIDLLERNFNSEDRVDVNRLKAKGLIQEDTAYIKILGRGQISKPLKVFANDFSLSAIKMIALTGGESIKVITIKKSN